MDFSANKKKERAFDKDSSFRNAIYSYLFKLFLLSIFSILSIPTIVTIHNTNNNPLVNIFKTPFILKNNSYYFIKKIAFSAKKKKIKRKLFGFINSGQNLFDFELAIINYLLPFHVINITSFR